MYFLLWVLGFLLLIILFGLRRVGAEKLPNRGPFLVICNHIHLLDAVAIGLCTFGKVRFMAKEELFRNRLFDWTIRSVGGFPVKRGAFDRGAIKTAIGVLEAGGIVGLFPEGTRLKGSEGETMLPMLNGAAMLAIKTGVPVYPAHISGKYRPFGKLRVRIGDPFPAEEYRGSALNKAAMDVLTRRFGEAIEALRP